VDLRIDIKNNMGLEEIGLHAQRFVNSPRFNSQRNAIEGTYLYHHLRRKILCEIHMSS
jgi:hypothetical protein